MKRVGPNNIKATREGMVDVTKCPPGTKIRQVQGDVNVDEWGTVLLEVDAAEGKRVIQLKQTLVVPNIKVNLFSLQCGKAICQSMVKFRGSASSSKRCRVEDMSKLPPCRSSMVGKPWIANWWEETEWKILVGPIALM